MLTYAQTIDYLYQHLPMYQRIGPAAYKKDLTNTLGLLAHLNQPQNSFKCIHVAGTNGKGSVSHMLAGLYAEAGLKVGLYTSPHYLHFRERIKVNGNMMSQLFLRKWVHQNKDFMAWLQPSFFEMSVALAFDYFSQQKVDLAIVEVGLGGRLDSTNVVQPLLSVVTNISWDHVAMLGKTLPQIAAEKAGIIKANTPVLIGEYQPEVAAVFAHRAQAENAVLHYAKDFCRLLPVENTPISQIVDIELLTNKIEAVSLFSAAQYQQQNVATALAATQIIEAHYPTLYPKISAPNISNTLANLPKITGIMGRWQVLNRKPLTIGDSGHNEDGLAQTMAQLTTVPREHLHFILGVVNDKDLEKMFAQLPKSDCTYYFCKADIPRGLSATILAESATAAQLFGRPYASVALAYKTAVQAARAADLIFIGGSIFTLAEVLALFPKGSV